MPNSRYTSAEIVQRGRDQYERQVKQHVEPIHNGRFVAVDIESGDYDVDDKAVIAARRLRDRHPDADIYIHRIGHETAFRLGARFLTDRS